MWQCGKALDVAQCEKGFHCCNPITPFECKIPGGLVDGRKIFIYAVCPDGAQRFSINLKNGAGSSEDIAFHFNPRFDEKDIVMNSRTSEDWQEEERTEKMPFRKRFPFLICLTTMQSGYEVLVNDEWLASFNHRSSYENVRIISVEGDVDILGVHIPNKNLVNEKVISIPGHIVDSETFVITGKTDSDCSSFSLNLQCGEGEDDNIAYHFNPRYDASEVICNSYTSGSWGDEEIEKDVQFARGETFAVTITAKDGGFLAKAEGREFPIYNHRVQKDEICTFTVKGDATVFDFSIQYPPNLKYSVETVKRQVDDPSLPAKFSISDFKPGSAIYVSAVIPSSPNRFKINLQSGPDEDNDDIMLHLNPRWDQGEPKIVMNSREGGNWGEEELWAGGDFPIQVNSEIGISVNCLDEGYNVVLNKQQQIFKHRIAYSRVNYAILDGDFQVKRITVV